MFYSWRRKYLLFIIVINILFQGHLSRIQLMSEIGYGISLASLIVAVLIMLFSRSVQFNPKYSDGFSQTCMGLPIVYLKRLQIYFFSKYDVFSVPEGSFKSKQCIPRWNAALCCISPVSSLLAKVLVSSIKENTYLNFEANFSFWVKSKKIYRHFNRYKGSQCKLEKWKKSNW